MLPAATCTDGAAGPAVLSTLPPHSSLAVVLLGAGSVCPCPASREGDPPGGSSCIPAKFDAGAPRSTQSRDPGSLSGNSRSTAPPSHFARVPAPSSASPATQPTARNPAPLRQTFGRDPGSDSDTGRAPEMP